VPRFTESTINWLCEQAKSASTQEELEVVIEQLRTALQEHIHLAKESLSAQANAVSMLENISGKNPKTGEKPQPRKPAAKKKT
jgi:hypothetical protein